jgi:hypothetical protein
MLVVGLTSILRWQERRSNAPASLGGPLVQKALRPQASRSGRRGRAGRNVHAPCARFGVPLCGFPDDRSPPDRFGRVGVLPVNPPARKVLEAGPTRQLAKVHLSPFLESLPGPTVDNERRVGSLQRVARSRMGRWQLPHPPQRSECNAPPELRVARSRMKRRWLPHPHMVPKRNALLSFASPPCRKGNRRRSRRWPSGYAFARRSPMLGRSVQEIRHTKGKFRVLKDSDPRQGVDSWGAADCADGTEFDASEAGYTTGSIQVGARDE